jgi:hypothetical protein
MTRLRFISWKLLITLLIAADLFALWIWATRPPVIYSYALGLVGIPEEAPIPRLLVWAAWENGPRTPTGCLALFETGDLFFAGVFLSALALLILILLALHGTDGPLWRRLSSPISLMKVFVLRFRVRTALAVIAILGLYLGWEIHAWRSWRLRSAYLEQRKQAAEQANLTRSQLETFRKALAMLNRPDGSPLTDISMRDVGYYRSKAARVVEEVALKDRWEREAAYLSATIAAYAQRARKYELAAADPFGSVAADEPLPEPVGLAGRWLAQRDYSRALAAYDELARAYPDYVDVHSHAAWLRATCPDSRYRDGRLAVAGATRACELTNWQDAGTLGTLAAACAEAGDFAAAVKWQQKVIALTARPANGNEYQERLALYAAGKPYQQK